GAHYTPPQLARFLAERAVAHLPPGEGTIRVLDPACGDGSLLRAIWEVSPTKLRRRLVLSGLDTDPVAVERARSGTVPISAECADFLMFPAAATANLIISNPPYVRTQVLGARRSRQLAARFGLSGRVDLYHA